MDDIYFWVLRIWGALTSNKKVLVGLVGVAAVVVTVTTVFAAPPVVEDAHPGSSDVFVSMEPPKSAVPVVMSMVAFDPMEELSIGGIDSPGLLPTSPFYFIKDMSRDVRYAFTFDPIDKANLRLRFANEDALAIRAMCVEQEYLEAAQQCFKYQDNFFTSLAWAVKAKKQGHDIEALMLNLMTAHHGHRLVLADALSVVDESQLEAVVGAITYTSAPFEQVIQWNNGPDEAAEFHAKLSNDFASAGQDVWLQIENRLGLDVEQAVALNRAMGDDSTVGSAPVITSVKAERFELDPGSTVAITCTAADLSGGTLTFQWLSSDGTLDGGDAATALWTAPEELGLYSVTVVVSDERGNQSRKSVNLKVGEPEQAARPQSDGPFWIEDVISERDTSGRSAISPPVLGQTWEVTERSVFVSSPIRVTCVMGGATDGLEYEWSADVGKVEGSGETAVWAAPNYPCKARVTVVIRNGSGDTAEGTVHFRVSTCASCFTW
ncbi:MAG: PKD domain-containing protein [Coriobacteriia bacterium]|nr:PKD domain-containing protein [Coriobacteriia bacterium]